MVVTWTYQDDDTDHSTFISVCLCLTQKKLTKLLNCFCPSPTDMIIEEKKQNKTDSKEVFTVHRAGRSFKIFKRDGSGSRLGQKYQKCKYKEKY